MDYYELEEYIRNKYGLSEFNFDAHIVRRMKDLILDSILSQKEKLFTNKKNQYELFGYDFMIDEDLRVWMIEVNTNPYLGFANTFIK